MEIIFNKHVMVNEIFMLKKHKLGNIIGKVHVCSITIRALTSTVGILPIINM